MKKDVTGSKNWKMGIEANRIVAMVPWRKLGRIQPYLQTPRCWIWQLKRRSFLQWQDGRRGSNLEDKGLLKEGLKVLASLSWMMWTFHQLWLEIRRCHSLYHSWYRDRYVPCTDLQLCEKHLSVGQEQSNHFRQLKAVWWRKWDLTGATIWYTLTLVWWQNPEKIVNS